MTRPKRIDPLEPDAPPPGEPPEIGVNLPPAEGWLYQEGAGWYDPNSIEPVEEGSGASE